MALTYDDIRIEFMSALNSDKRATKLWMTINKGTGTYKTASEYAVRVGDVLGKVLRNHAPLVDIYEWDVDELIPQALGMNHRIVSGACEKVQTAMNRKSGVGIRPQLPKFDGNRAYGIVQELKTNPEFTNIEKTFYDQLTNFTQNVVDESIRDNAEVQSNAGVKAYIVRTAEAHACDWCQEMAGTYDYKEVKATGNPVWGRHENCRCTIDYVTEYYTERVYNQRKAR